MNFLAFDIEGDLDPVRLARAITTCVSRHEALSSVVAEPPDGTVQLMLTGQPRVDVEIVDVAADDLARLVDEQAHQSLDPRHGMVRARIYRAGNDRHVLVLGIHHLAVDGAAVGIVLDEIGQLYRAGPGGDPEAALAPPELQYGDFAQWQRAQHENGAYDDDLQRWADLFREQASAPRPWVIRESAEQRRGSGQRHQLDLPADFAAKLNAACRRHGVTAFMLTLAAFQAFLARWSGASTALVTTPFSMRHRPETEGMVGYLANLMFLMTDLPGHLTTREALYRVRDTVLAAFERRETPFELVRRLPEAAELLPVGLAAPVSFDYEEDDGAELVLGDGLRVEARAVERRLARSPLGLTVRRAGDRFVGYLAVGSGLSSEAAASWPSAIEAYLTAFVDDDETALDALPGGGAAVVRDDSAPTAPVEPQPGPGPRSAAPVSPAEQEMAALWAELLGCSDIGVDDNFFLLGGSSMHAMRLVARLRRRIPQIRVGDLFQNPTVRTLSAALEERSWDPRPETSSSPEADVCSFGQERMWYLQQADPADTSYNTVSRTRIEGALDVSAWQRAVAALVRQHPPLRSTYVVVDGRLRQRPVDTPFVLNHVDLSQVDPVFAEQTMDAMADRLASQPFDLTTQTPFRALLLTMPDGTHAFTYVAHHICFDARSESALWPALVHAYEVERAGTAPAAWPVRDDYHRWAARHRADVLGHEQDGRLDRCAVRLSGCPPVALPPGDPATSGVAEPYPLALDRDVVAGLDAVARQYGCTMFALCMAVFTVVLAEIGGGDRFTVAAAVDCREDPALDDVLGYFGNLQVVSAEVARSGTFGAHLDVMRAQVEAALDDADVPFDRVVRRLRRAGGDHAELVNTFFTLYEPGRPGPTGDGLTFHRLPVAPRRPAFALELLLEAGPNGIAGSVSYQPDRMAPEAAREVADTFVLACREVGRNPDVAVADLLGDREHGGSPPRQAVAVEDTVLKVLSEVLDTPVDPLADFFDDLAGHSLQAAVVAAEISQAVDVHVPVRLVLHCRTGREIARAVEGLIRSAPVGAGAAETTDGPGHVGPTRSSPEPVLVTGATGMVGWFVLQALRRAGVPVRATARPQSERLPAQLATETVIARLEDPESIVRAARGTAAIIHLATGWTQPDVDEQAAEALLSAWGDVPFVLLSSVDVYGSANGPAPLTEQTPFDPSYSAYSDTKVRVEKALLRAAQARGRDDFSILRTPHVWGPHPHCRWQIQQGPAARLYRAFRNGEDLLLPGTDQAEWQGYGDSFVDARDLAELVVGCLSRPVGGAVNVSAGFFSWTDFLTRLSELVDRPVKIRHGGPRETSVAETRRYDTTLMGRHFGGLAHRDWRETLHDVYRTEG